MVTGEGPVVSGVIYCSVQTSGKTRERIVLSQGEANSGRKHNYEKRLKHLCKMQKRK